MIEQLKSHIRSADQFRRLTQAIGALPPGSILPITGVGGSLAAVVAGLLQEVSSRQVFFVAPDPEAAERVYADLVLAAGGEGAVLFDVLSRHGAPRLDPAGDADALSALRALVTDSVHMLVAPARSLRVRLPAIAAVKEKPFSIAAGELLPFADFLGRLADLGFQRKDFVEARGDCAVRGGIIDVFPFVGENPVRLEFSADEVGSIREFDPASQRSIRELSAVVLVPDLFEDQAGHTASLLDYLAPDAIILLEEPERLRAELETAGDPVSEEELAAIGDLLGMFPRVHITALPPNDHGFIDFGGVMQQAFNGSIALLQSAIRKQLDAGWSIFLTSDTHSEQTRIRELLGMVQGEDRRGGQDGEPAEPPLNVASIDFSTEALHSGFSIPSLKIAVYTEHQIFNRVKRRGKKRAPRFRAIRQSELLRLHKGDFVVHQDFGIGRFDGLKKISVRNVEQEVVTVLYEERDTLYVNLNYINKLQKYSSKEGHVPKLTRLGSAEWDRLKSRAKKRVKDIARELIRLYAKRKQLPGFSFPADTPWQKELEASFMYEDTFDQAKATLDVKQDMAEPSPMDRLICGDVGFGKTEVAVRAAFKAVLAGKQVAVLVPTTILAVQHYHTFLDRVSRYGVSIQVISRFKSKQEQSGILAQLKAGAIDMIIGTHRLLSKDVAFKDLGLLIIDEEHRFGVTAKEKLRQLRAEVDTLTLTATPIPRTLHFSLLGARDLSIIATPPRNRLPVATEITQWNDELIKEAVSRELQRGGQVYFVHDRVQTIEEVCARLRDLMPAARLRFAHGQLPPHDLEEVMLDFLERKFDLLVSTKIIESGLDIPNVNTIIINRADRFGMAELYQLRGRVGRSNIQAYAYLLTPPVSVLPKSTLLRLQAVEEFTELGSGFNLAMRDLEIRGAGNLLGSEQSGFIEAMGFETYTRILDEAVQELKQEEFKEIFEKESRGPAQKADTLVEAEFDALITDAYVSNDVERLSIYRRLYALSSRAELEEIGGELRDRFGPFPREVENLFAIIRIRLIASHSGFRKVYLGKNRMLVEFPPEDDRLFYEGEEFQALMERVSHMKKQGLYLKQEEKRLTLSTHIEGVDGKALEYAEKVLASVVSG